MRAYVRASYVRPSVCPCVRGVRARRACVACVGGVGGMRGWRGGVRGWRACVRGVCACVRGRRAWRGVRGWRGVAVAWRWRGVACCGVLWRAVRAGGRVRWRGVGWRAVACRAVRCGAVRAYGGSYHTPYRPYPFGIFLKYSAIVERCFGKVF